MANTKKVCIFVDGENLRHSIGDLFPAFDRKNHLPETDWTKFFDWIACEAVGSKDVERVRTYWYVVQDIDFSPSNLNIASKTKISSEILLSKNKERADILAKIANLDEKQNVMRNMIDELLDFQTTMEKRFAGWIHLQDSIARRSTSVEFRRAGYIRYDLFNGQFGSEKAVDVNLGVDLFRLKDIYDVAVIVSGDQDYMPAVDAVKDFGKHTVNVAFRTQNDKLLPGGAKRLSQSTDRAIELQYAELKTHLGL